MNKRKIKDIIIDQLSLFGVKNIYGYAGDTILRFFSALQRSQIKLYTTKHEGTAGLMASAESKLTGNLSVCVAHSGPGTANIVNGIADAYSDKTPMLLISGQVPTYNMGTNYKQFVDQRQLTNPLTEYSAVLVNPHSIVDILYKAMTKAISKGGVSHIVIPMDLWEAETNAVPREFPAHLNRKTLPQKAVLDNAVKLINKAKKPIILFGRGSKDSKDRLVSLSHRLSAPLIDSLPATGMIDLKSNPYFVGGLGQGGSKVSKKLLNESDLILIFGATWWPMDYTPRRPPVIHFDISPDNIASSHTIELGVVGDINVSIYHLLKKVHENENKEWKQKIEYLRDEWINSISIDKEDNTKAPFCPGAVIDILNDYISQDEIITLDSGDNVIWFSKYFNTLCKDLLISGSWRTMGFALPAALAAKINMPENPVTAITGDGGLDMVMAELTTAARYNLAIRLIVINNGTLAMEKNRMITAGLNQEEIKLTNPDFKMLAEACNIDSHRATSLNQLKKVLQQSSSLNKSILIDIPCKDPILPGTKL